MTAVPEPALQTAMAYYKAWAAKDLEQTMSFVDDDIVCDAPAGRLVGAAAYRGFLESYFTLLKGATLIAAMGDNGTAILLHDNETIPVPSAPSASYLTVVDGRITRIQLIFDRVPYQAAAALQRV